MIAPAFLINPLGLTPRNYTATPRPQINLRSQKPGAIGTLPQSFRKFQSLEITVPELVLSEIGQLTRDEIRSRPGLQRNFIGAPLSRAMKDAREGLRRLRE